MKKTAVFVVLVIVVLVAAGCKTYPTEGLREAPEVGAIAPRFTLTDTAGAQVSLEDHRGKVVLLNFWATWCPPCRQEMPDIQSRYEMHHPNLVVLAIDNNEPLDLVQSYVDEVGLSFNPLLDPGADVQILYQIRGYPTSMFVDENGIIQIVHVGLMTQSQLDDYLSQMGFNEPVALD